MLRQLRIEDSGAFFYTIARSDQQVMLVTTLLDRELYPLEDLA
jgi:hypothetical protein